MNNEIQNFFRTWNGSTQSLKTFQQQQLSPIDEKIQAIKQKQADLQEAHSAELHNNLERARQGLPVSTSTQNSLKRKITNLSSELISLANERQQLLQTITEQMEIRQQQLNQAMLEKNARLIDHLSSLAGYPDAEIASSNASNASFAHMLSVEPIIASNTATGTESAAAPSTSMDFSEMEFTTPATPATEASRAETEIYAPRPQARGPVTLKFDEIVFE